MFIGNSSTWKIWKKNLIKNHGTGKPKQDDSV